MTAAKQLLAEIPAPAGLRVPVADDSRERLARLRLARSENVGPRTFLHLMGRFGTADKALEALPALAARGGRSEYIACPIDIATAELEAGERSGATLLTIGDEIYSGLLAAIDNPPPVLWVRGDPELLSRPSIAIVGARNASAIGQRTTRRLAYPLGELGYVVVSGLARGIDTAAHEATIETGTIAVLAGGLDQVYPTENTELAEQIAEQGLLISECAMGVEPTSRHFPRRNRLISGLSLGVLLIEAAVRSGSLITARFALEQGREAMACPGAPDDPRAGGCNQLIRDGAALIRTTDDVIDALAAPRTLSLREEGSEFLFDTDSCDDDLADDFDALNDFDSACEGAEAALAEQIVRSLGPNPIDQDELARACGASPAELSLALLELDLAGRVEITSDGSVTLAGDDD